MSSLDSVVLANPDEVTPHEIAVDRHVQELVSAISSDGFVRHPIVSVAAGPRYVLLDGTHRLAALASLQVRRVPIQVFNARDVTFATWAKIVVHRQGCDSILRTPLAWRRGHNAAAAVRIIAADGSRWHSGKSATTLDERHDTIVAALSSIDDADEIRASVPSHVKTNGPTSFVLDFRPWTLDEVIELARQRKRLPSGLTRVIVSGRILNLRVPLDILHNQHLDSSAWSAFISAAKRRARIYDEPTVLVD
jgi:hypothetical protein